MPYCSIWSLHIFLFHRRPCNKSKDIIHIHFVPFGIHQIGVLKMYVGLFVSIKFRNNMGRFEYYKVYWKSEILNSGLFGSLEVDMLSNKTNHNTNPVVSVTTHPVVSRFVLTTPKFIQASTEWCIIIAKTYCSFMSVCNVDYSMLGADSRFWLTNNRDAYSHISRLMTSQWRSRPPNTFLTAAMWPNNAVFIRWFRPDKGVSEILKLQKSFRIQFQTNIFWAWDKLVATCLLPRIREFYSHLALEYHAWSSAARGIAMLHMDALPYPRQLTRVTNSI